MATVIALSLILLFVLASRRRDVSVRLQVLPTVRIEIDARAACCRRRDLPEPADTVPELEIP